MTRRLGRHFRVGIDEVGRGPLAGPVAVGVVMIRREFDQAHLAKVRDSKSLTEKQRVSIYQQIRSFGESGGLWYTVSFVSVSVVDQLGINSAIALALERGLKKIGTDPKNTSLLLDGGLKAPVVYGDQTSIIKGDQSDCLIGAASIMAKVERDKRMERLAFKFPGYGLERHKGYGTLLHRRAIKELGLSPIHRKTFCRRLD